MASRAIDKIETLKMLPIMRLVLWRKNLPHNIYSIVGRINIG